MSAFLDKLKLNRAARRMKKGDRRAAEKIFDALFQKFFAFARTRLSRPEDAEDVVQESFLKIVANIERYDTDRDFSAWAWAIVRHSLIDFYRRKKTEPFSKFSAENSEFDVLDERQNSERRSIVSEIMEALTAWDEQDREIFELHFLADLDYRTISSMTGINQGALRVKIHRFKNKIKNQWTSGK